MSQQEVSRKLDKFEVQFNTIFDRMEAGFNRMKADIDQPGLSLDRSKQ